MDNQDLRTLKLLEEIDNEPVSSQRDLARKLNISVGLTNSFIKRLVQKGYFKITTIPRNRVSYILTPKGVAEKSRLTYEYIRYSFQFYKTARKELQKILMHLEMEAIRNVVFCGVSDLAEIAFISLQETSLRLLAVVDDEMIGRKFLSYTVQGSNDLPTIPYDRILITRMDTGARPCAHLENLGIDRRKIIEVYPHD